MALLRLERHGRDRPSFEPTQRDRLAGHFTIAIFTLVKTADRAIDLGNELALAVAGTKLDRPIGLARRAIGDVGLAQRIDLELRHRLARFLDDRFLPRL